MMMADQLVFHGTDDERAALLLAIGRNCACEYAPGGVRTSTCPPHDMLVSDQRAIDGLIYQRRRFASQRAGSGQRRIPN